MKQPKANWASGENMLHEGCVGQWLPKSVMENQIRAWQRRIDHDRSTWKPRTPNTYRNPKSLDLARSKRHSDILCWSFLVFDDLCWSLLIFSDLLRQTVRPSSTTLQPPSPLPTPVTWEVVHGWTHEWTVVWIVGSIKALSAEGNQEMNGNDTSVNSTWITQHPNTCILPHRTCTSLNVQPVQRHVTLPLEPRPMYPFFLAGPQHGGAA